LDICSKRKYRYIRILICILLFVFLFSFPGCDKNNPENETSESENSYSEEVEMAIAALKETWSEDFSFSNEKPYLEIKNTRIIFIKEDTIDDFSQINYIVEFVLFSNYFGSEPYYENIGVNDSIAVYNDGSIEVCKKNPFMTYRSKTMENDFSDIIESLADLGAKYNQVLEI